MRKAAIVIMLIACAVAGAMKMLPGDGARLTVYGIEAEIAESPDGLELNSIIQNIYVTLQKNKSILR